jgi:glycosyltransferase involved in cell wall biosynthesis
MVNIRLLHLFKSFSIGGIEKSTILYSNRLVDEISFVGIFAQKGRYDHTNLVSEKVRLFFPPLNVRLTIFSFPLYLVKIWRIIQRHNINIVNYHHRIYSPIVWCIKLFHPTLKILYTAHNYFNDYKNHFITADRIIAVSEAVKKDLMKLYDGKVDCIVHGVTLRGADAAGSQNFTVGYVGRLERQKGIMILLEAMKILIGRNPKYELLLRGEGTLEREIVSRSVELSIDTHVVFDPPRIDSAGIFDGIDVLVLPSISLEGFGLVIIEAMSAGIPIVGTDTTGINEIIIDGYNGRLTPPGDPVSLADMIRSVLEDRGAREKYRANGRGSVAEKYSIERYIADYCRIMREL